MSPPPPTRPAAPPFLLALPLTIYISVLLNIKHLQLVSYHFIVQQPRMSERVSEPEHTAAAAAAVNGSDTNQLFSIPRRLFQLRNVVSTLEI